MPRTVIMLLALAVPGLAAAAEPRVEIVGHRGASHDAPENTVAALRLAFGQGADGTEFDVYVSKDGHPVVIHDKTTKRTAGVDKPVAGSTLADLRALDVGRWKEAAFAGERVPTVAEMLAAVPAGKRAFVEIKCGPDGVPAILAAIKTAGLAADRTPVIAFDARVIAAVKEARPDLPAYWLVDLKAKPKPGTEPPTAERLIAKVRELKADGLDLSAAPALDAAYARAVKAAGLKLYVWTVNDPAEAKRLAGLGADGITTDRPGWLRDQLAR